MLRVGIGSDLHRLASGKKLILGGVEIPSKFGSIAHSDGDALVHAIIDSILSPLGAGDIGMLFPDTDERYRGASSLSLLAEVVREHLAGAVIQNVDCVIILDQPKIARFIPEMKRKLAEILKITPAQIGIKGKTSENTRIMTVECTAVSLLEINPGS